MTSRRISAEDLLEPPLSSDDPKRGVDIGLGHDQRQGTIEGLGIGARREDLLRPIELRLVDANVLVAQHRCGGHDASSTDVHDIRDHVHKYCRMEDPRSRAMREPATTRTAGRSSDRPGWPSGPGPAWPPPPPPTARR